MSASRVSLSRQWVPVAGGSCDVRMGYSALEEGSALFKNSVGKPRACMAVVPAGLDASTRELLARQMADAGFSVSWHEVPAQGARTLEEAARLATHMAEERLTADDLCCALGGQDLLSLAAHVCDGWCGGMSLVAVPTSAVAFLRGALSPVAIDVAGSARMLTTRTGARHVLLDYDMVCGERDDEAMRHARVLMVAAATCSSERAFSALWDNVDALMGGDDEAFVGELITAAKSRGKLVSSTAAAMRQSVDYGQTFAYALAGLVPSSASQAELLAEGMRFAARLSVAEGKLSLDDMLAQDELLEAVGAGVLACDVEPKALCDALRQERFAHTNRFMLLAPLALGRVRMLTVEDDVLLEHATAWCDAHR